MGTKLSKKKSERRTRRKRLQSWHRVTSRFSLEEWLLRGVSLLLAVVLWSFVGGESRIDKDIMVPVEIINLPQELVISNQYKKELRVSVNGTRSTLQDMGKIIRMVDLSAANEGSKVVRNTVEDIPMPRGVTVQRIQPSSIILSLDSLVSKQLPIEVHTTGKVAKGFYLQAKRVNPQSINITGSRTNLLDIDTLITRPVDLSSIQESTQMQVPLELSPELVNMIGETSVTVSLDIRPVAENITIEGLPIQATVDGEKVDIEPKRATIVAAIPASYIKTRTAPSSLVQVWAEGRKGDSKLRVQAAGREGLLLPIYIESVTPRSVAVTDNADSANVVNRGELKNSGKQQSIDNKEAASQLAVPMLKGKKKRLFIRTR